MQARVLRSSGPQPKPNKAVADCYDRVGNEAAMLGPPPEGLRVTNLMNGKCVTVRINDRGPFVRGRIIDVTLAAAEALGMIDAGVAKVTIDIVR